MKDCVAVVDCGTTGIKAALFDLKGRILGEQALPSPAHHTPDGGVTIDPEALYAATAEAVRGAAQAAGTQAAPIALSVTNQRATVVCLDERDRPVGPAISWQDMRGAAPVDAFRQRLSDESFYELTGLPLNPVFTLGKLLWIKKEEPEHFRRTARFALVHDFILRRWGAAEWITDESNASLTGLMHVRERIWCEEIFDCAELPIERMPRLVASGTPVGTLSPDAARATGLPAGLPLIAGGGDQQCAGLGMGAVRPGVMGITLGTAAAPLCATDRPRPDPQRRVSCCAHAQAGRWELEGLQSCAGAGQNWLCRVAGIDESAFVDLRTEALAADADGLLFLPYLYGASAPFWNPEARGAFIGLRAEHGRADLLRAVMEGVAFETRQILEVFDSLGAAVTDIRLTGGGSRGPAWKQIYADALGRPVYLPAQSEATLLGAAMLAARGAEVFDSMETAADAMVSMAEACEPRPVRRNAMEHKYGAFNTWSRRLAAREKGASI